MRETSFIKQNKEKWKEFEKILAYQDKDPDKLNDLFIQITDDLSYSRTFYPNRSVRVYLNNLAQQIFYRIYKNKKARLGRLWYFWTDELPQLVYNARTDFRLSFAVFLLSFLIGVLSSAMNPDFARVILGDGYIDMTIENIESGDPMAVYKQKGAFSMSLGITANNMYVAFRTFISGILFGIGSIGIMLFNGIMVGAFQHFFIEKGLFWESFLTIWTHGTLEISAIIIAGAAGITLGRGLAFPGTLTRLQAFQVSARRGLKIMMGIAPIIILAGFIEGYLTRFTETPDIIRGLFILLCLVFVLGYFVWYPQYRARQGFRERVKDTELPPDVAQKIQLTEIKSAGDVFAEVFIFCKKRLSSVFGTAAIASLIYTLFTFLSATGEIANLFSFPNRFFGGVSVVGQFFVHEQVTFLPIISTLAITLAVFVPMTYLVQFAKPEIFTKETRNFYVLSFLKMLIPMAFVELLLMTYGWYTFLLMIAFGPMLFLWAFVGYYERLNVFQSIGRTFNLLSGNFAHLLGLFSILFLVGILFYGILDSTILWLFFDIIGWNLSLEQTTMELVLTVMLTAVSFFFVALFFTILAVGTGLSYFSLLEIEEAPGLKEKIKYIGVGKRIQGMETEG